MAYHNLLACIHTPVSADGACIKNAFGVVIARMEYRDNFATAALCDLINMGAEVAKVRNAEHDAREAQTRAMFLGREN